MELMANSQYSTTKFLLVLTILYATLQLLYVSSFEFEVGDNSGWVVPTANDSKIYNGWASDKRFKVGDTLRFKYKKDSVMEVRETGYKKCNSTRPKIFSNDGNTIVKLNHPGFYYFISGSNGHCQRGQRMIIQVMSHDHDHASDDSSSSSGGTSSSAAAISLIVESLNLWVLFYFLLHLSFSDLVLGFLIN